MRLTTMLAVSLASGCLAVDNEEIGEESFAVLEVREHGDVNCRGSCGQGCDGCWNTWQSVAGTCYAAKICRSDPVCRNHDACYDACTAQHGSGTLAARMCQSSTDGRAVDSLTVAGGWWVFNSSETVNQEIGAGAAYATCGLAKRTNGNVDTCTVTASSKFPATSRTGSWTRNWFSDQSFPLSYQWNETQVVRFNSDGTTDWWPGQQQVVAGTDSSCDTAAVQQMWHLDQAKLYSAWNAQEGPRQYYDGQIVYPHGGAVASNLCSPIMRGGEQLLSGQMRMSSDGRFGLTYQKDGNLVLYQGTLPLWHSGTQGKSLGRAIMQTDGNLVVYNASNQPVWHSATHGNWGAYLWIQNDGNLVVYASNGAAKWNTRTCCR